MLDQVVGVVMLGLGLVMPVSGQVKGDSTDTSKNSTIRYEKKKQDLVVPRTVQSSGSAEERKKYTEAIENKTKNLQSVGAVRVEKFLDDLAQQRKKVIEEGKERQEEFKKKLELIKDERKKEIVENIEKRLDQINAKRTTVMTTQINFLSDKLDRIIAEASVQKEKGEDTSNLDRANTDAQAAISAARTAITTQSGKSYTITLTSEETAKPDVQAAIKTLETDLKSTYAFVTGARNSVLVSVGYLKTLIGDADLGTK